MWHIYSQHAVAKVDCVTRKPPMPSGGGGGRGGVCWDGNSTWLDRKPVKEKNLSDSTTMVVNRHLSHQCSHVVFPGDSEARFSKHILQ